MSAGGASLTSTLVCGPHSPVSFLSPSPNSQKGELKNSIGNGEAKELICGTHGLELRQWGGGCGWEGVWPSFKARQAHGIRADGKYSRRRWDVWPPSFTGGRPHTLPAAPLSAQVKWRPLLPSVAPPWPLSPCVSLIVIAPSRSPTSLSARGDTASKMQELHNTVVCTQAHFTLWEPFSDPGSRLRTLVIRPSQAVGTQTPGC